MCRNAARGCDEKFKRHRRRDGLRAERDSSPLDFGDDLMSMPSMLSDYSDFDFGDEYASYDLVHKTHLEPGSRLLRRALRAFFLDFMRRRRTKYFTFSYTQIPENNSQDLQFLDYLQKRSFRTL